ncbi:hypothetical protein LTR70_008466 [Exophiala xenobiotica]|uniref:HotDog ACOT-type domain-containing protein n=1 Tax=Lithohypha guttulata TaxID=1690604 RepID=A0ABR0K2I7_9EURO|nr:hypothetical protein LTR24_008099 [Lithohypha guttulata]KAK5311965.1 hypothetical protein LTR70_008466 [Exophiala xenobiotica]
MRSTDGVYKELTAMRVRKPWIEALRESKQAGQGSSTPKEYPKPDTTPKTMKDSYVKIVLPLVQDPWLLDTYANATGQLRTGAILMDLDAMAGVVAYKHTGEVTAAVDRISIKNPLHEICDLELSGQVTFATGRSSMEITLQVAKAPQPGQSVTPDDVFMTCSMTMVALDPATKKPVNIAPLKVESHGDRALFAKGEENYNSKKALKGSHILSMPPNEDESTAIHKMWTENLAYADSNNPATQPSNAISMAKSNIHSTQISQPQYRNRHNFMVFGGYLLKQTFELAFTCASAFSHSRVQFLNLDPSTFEEPVPVGSVLYIGARVTYTEPDKNGGTRVQVMVNTHVRDIEHAERKNTGTFFYTFHTDADVMVLPQTYSEFMMWVQGRRRAKRLDATLHADGKDAQILTGGSTSNVTE